MRESEVLGGGATIKTIAPSSKAMMVRGPLNCDEERSAIGCTYAYTHMYTCHMRARTHTLSEEPTGECIPPLGVQDKPQPFAGTRR